MYVGIQAMKSSPVYIESTKRAMDNAEVQAALGTPIETRWMVQGKIDVSNDQGGSDFTIPITGPKGKGTLRVVATSTGGKLSYSVMEVNVGGKTIDLLDGKPEGKPEGKMKDFTEPK